MDGHFRAFSFVDRITGVEPGVCIRGQYTIPPAVDAFPDSLVAEAVGQLAAWAAMAALDCSHRPVAGIAGRIELLSAVRPGQVLDLAAELESVDTETVGYGGTAHAGGRPVLRLRDCVGPMVPVEDFDDPKSVRDRLTLLRAAGAPPGAFGGLPALPLERGGGEEGRRACAVLRVPAVASLFADHFPRRPVFPGTLLMHANLQTAALLASEVPAGGGTRWVPRIVSDVKLRTFIAPGDTLDLEARRTGHSDTVLSVTVESRINQRLVGSAALQFSPEAPP
jgi:3-hydroxymyristoyl/3-hydroxydecanoyl-(acyl carrier protein) dehydratase